MLIDPNDLQNQLDRLEEIEKASLRLVVQGIYDFRYEAQNIFRNESDEVADIAEDITREALDRIGVSKIDQRLFGKIDYKRARFIFHPDYTVKQALFIDSKAENISGRGTATLQTSQISMSVKQIRAGVEIDHLGELPRILQVGQNEFLTTTIFVKYNYSEDEGNKSLDFITVVAVPNGFLQSIYNPSAEDTIWLAGRDAPTRGESFRVRVSFERLKAKMLWRVQRISMVAGPLRWDQ